MSSFSPQPSFFETLLLTRWWNPSWLPCLHMHLWQSIIFVSSKTSRLSRTEALRLCSCLLPWWGLHWYSGEKQLVNLLLSLAALRALSCLKDCPPSRSDDGCSVSKLIICSCNLKGGGMLGARWKSILVAEFCSGLQPSCFAEVLVWDHTLLTDSKIWGILCGNRCTELGFFHLEKRGGGRCSSS